MLGFITDWVWGKDVEIFPVVAAVSEDVFAVALEGIWNGSPRPE